MKKKGNILLIDVDDYTNQKRFSNKSSLSIIHYYNSKSKNKIIINTTISITNYWYYSHISTKDLSNQ